MSNTNSANDNIKKLFQRPNEPLFTLKDNGKTAFEVPADFYVDRYKTIGETISNRVGEDVERNIIHLTSVPHPSLDFTKTLPIKGPFSLFKKSHLEIAGQMIKIFLDLPDPMTLLSTAAYIKDRVNPYLFLVNFSFFISKQY